MPLFPTRCPGCSRVFNQIHTGHRFCSAGCCSDYYTRLNVKRKSLPAYPDPTPSTLKPGESIYDLVDDPHIGWHIPSKFTHPRG